jgi:transcriptional regulator with XRE-family HTH domain
VGNRVRSERKRLGLTLEELALKVGVKAITLHRIETGKSSPSVVLLSESAKHLKSSIVSFVDIPKPIVYIKSQAQEAVISVH